MAVGRDTKAFTECVALHHLRLQPGIFRLKGRLSLPTGLTGRLAKNTGSVKALQVICTEAAMNSLLAHACAPPKYVALSLPQQCRSFLTAAMLLLHLLGALVSDLSVSAIC